MSEERNLFEKIKGGVGLGRKEKPMPMPEKPVERETPKTPEHEPKSAESAPESEGSGSRERAGAAARSSDDDIQMTPELEKREKEIEKVLEDDLGDIYMNLSPDKQKEFKKAGEQTAHKINIMLARGKAGAMKIVELIKKWLKLIPGVNKFFLEQEAKIKTDEILKMNRK